MNRITLIVKLIEDPKQSFFENDICVAEVLAEFTTKYRKANKKKNVAQISVWGDQGKNLAMSHRIGDFLIVEAFISLRPIYLEGQESLIIPKIIDLATISFYPYYFSPENKKNLKNLSQVKKEIPTDSENEEFPF